MTFHNPEYFEHPVFNPEKLHLDTLAYDQLRRFLERSLWLGATEAYILGSSRVGKTTAARSLVNQLKLRNGISVPGIYISISARDQDTVKSVLQLITLGAQLHITEVESANSLSDRMTLFISDIAATYQISRIILIVDEMQRLHPEQLNAFAEIYDKLRLLGIYLMVVFIGNSDESTSLMTKIQSKGYAHIRGRFFSHRGEIDGLRSEQELIYCLKQYDTLRYPSEGPTYLGYFLPEAENEGWRLGDQGAQIWRVFRNYQKQYGIRSWGMQYFTVSINTLLADFLPEYGIEKFSDEMLHECFRLSGIVPDLVTPI